HGGPGLHTPNQALLSVEPCRRVGIDEVVTQQGIQHGDILFAHGVHALFIQGDDLLAIVCHWVFSSLCSQGRMRCSSTQRRMRSLLWAVECCCASVTTALAVTRRNVARSSNQTSARPSTTVSGPDSTRETQYLRTSGNFFT